MKNFTKGTVIAVLIGFILCFGLLSRFTPKNQKANGLIFPTADTTLPQATENTNSPLPLRLKIPKINIDAPVEYVGLTAEGRVDVPKGPNEAAWFNLSPRPGESGSSIIDGHSGWKNDIPAVFDDLYKLRKGDKIYIEDSDGKTVTFVVREYRSYNPNANADNVFNSNDGKAHLNLITCTGIWNTIDKTHSDRLVVFADIEEGV